MHSDMQTVNDENESRLCVMLALRQQAYLMPNKHWHVDQHPDISARATFACRSASECLPWLPVGKVCDE